MGMIAEEWQQLLSAEINFLRRFKAALRDNLTNTSVREDLVTSALQDWRNKWR
jgi:hypothetical protein